MDTIKTKVAKLLALSKNNSNVHESAAAFAQAQRLVAKHNLDLAAIEKAEVTNYNKHILFSGKRKSDWKARLGSALAKANNCYVWFNRDKGYFAINLGGDSSDIEIVTYLFESISNQIELLCKNYMSLQNMGKSGAKHVANSFKLGAVVAVSQALENVLEEVKEEYKGTQALIVIQNKIVQAESWVKSQIQISGKEKSKASLVDGKAYSSGLEAGRKVHFKKGLSEKVVDKV